MASDPALTLPVVVTADAEPGRARLEADVTACFDEWRRPLMRYLLACRLDAHDSEEIVQEVFLALFRHLGAGKPRQNLRGWVFRVAHNLMLKHRQSQRMASAFTTRADDRFEAGAADPAPDPEGQLQARQRQARLLAVLAALPERDRSCVHLRAEGLTYREIADVAGVSLGAVALSLARGLGRLARADER